MSDAAVAVDIEDRMYANIRANIRVLKALNRIPTRELSTPLGLSGAVFSARLNGVSRFTALEVIVLARLLGTTAEELAEDPLISPGDAAEAPVRHYLEGLERVARSRCFDADMLLTAVSSPARMQLPIFDEGGAGWNSRPDLSLVPQG